jgi:hypothetical protein
MRKYHGVLQMSWGTWVVEITDRTIDESNRLVSFHSAAYVSKTHDIAAKLNFAFDEP